MSVAFMKKSTIVRKKISLALLKSGYCIGGQLVPRLTTRHAVRLLCTPGIESRLRAREAVDGGAARDDLVVDGRRIAVYRWGSAGQPRVVLAHGWSSHALRFLPWVQALGEAGYAVTAFDQPGHGHSGGTQCTLADFVRTLAAVAHRDGPFAAAIGHSLGGAAVTLALANGDLAASRVILIAPASNPVAATERFTRQLGLVEGMVARILAYLEQQVGVTTRELTAATRAVALGMPMLVAHDFADPVVPWEEGESCVRTWSGARLLSTHGLGHNRIVDDPGILEAGLRFLCGETIGERVVSTPNLPFGLA